MKRNPGLQALLATAATISLVGCGGGGGGNAPTPQNPGSGSQPGQLQFAATQPTVDEAAGTLTINVTRTSGSDGVVGVSIATSDGTATAGQDYTAVGTTISFAAGDSAQKSITLNVANDAADEPDETFTIVLSNPTGGATLGTQTTATILITDDDEPAGQPLPSAVTAVVSAKTKALTFTWTGGANSTSFRLMAAATGEAFAQVGADLQATATGTQLGIATHLYNWVLEAASTVKIKRYRIDGCNAAGCTPSNVLDVEQVLSVLATGYLKASETTADSELGTAVAVSGDGKTLVLGAPGMSNDAGAVFVYRYGIAQSGESVLLPTPDRISAPSQIEMRFGAAVAVNENGTVLAVGAPSESHDQQGIGAYPNVPNDNAPKSGAVFIYSRASVNDPWSPTPVYVKANDADDFDAFGTSISLNTDGTVLVAGAPNQDGSGAVYASIFTANQWTMLADIVKAPNADGGDQFGAAVAVNSSGSVILVGAPAEDGSGGGGFDPPDDDAVTDSGAMYFVSVDEIKQHAPELRLREATRRFKAHNAAVGAAYGTAVATNRTSNVIAVGAPFAINDRGQAYIYSTNNNPQGPAGLDTASLVPSRFGPLSRYGSSISLSADGNVIAVGSVGNTSADMGVDSAGAFGNLGDAGAVDVLIRPPATNWSLIALNALDIQFVKPVNPGPLDRFGTAVALSADGSTLLVGAPGEDGNGVGHSANNNLADNSVLEAGAAYLY